MKNKKLSYRHAIKRAATVLKDRKMSMKLIDNAKETLQSKAKVSEKVRSAKKIFSDYIRLLRSYINGSYRDISWKSILYITAVLIYFVTPTDIIPDFLPVTGFIDDATLAIWLYQYITKEMEKFITWELEQKANSNSDKKQL